MGKTLSIVLVSLVIGALAGYLLPPKPDEARMKHLEAKIKTFHQELTEQQKIAQDALHKLNAIEEKQKQIDLQMKGDLHDLHDTNTQIKDVFKRLRAQVGILRKALCHYSSDFCAPAHGSGAGAS